MKKTLVTMILLSSKIWAVQCYFTIAKSPCWKDYDIDVTLVDMKKQQEAQKIRVPKDCLYNRANFECSPAEVFSAYAEFLPVVWDQDKGKKYPGVRFWAMPESSPRSGAVWEINICYPGHFSGLPLPKSDVRDCGCDFSQIPAIENQNK